MQGPPMHRLHAHDTALKINFIANSETGILRRVEIVAKHSAGPSRKPNVMVSKL